MQKARRRPKTGLRPLVDAWFQVLFHSPVRGAFHLSLTVLVRYRSLGSVQPCRMVPADSHGIPPVPRYSGFRCGWVRFRVRDSHPLRCAFPGRFPYQAFAGVAVLQPRARLDAHGLGSSPFAHHYLGNHCCFLLLRLLRCFSSAGSPPLRDSPCGLGCPIRTSADRRPFAPPRGFSQLITSFVASESQGIPHTPLVTSFVLLLVRILALVLLLRPLHHVIEPRAPNGACADAGPSAAPHPVEDTGFEPVTPCLQSRCSSQLSQTPSGSPGRT